MTNVEPLPRWTTAPLDGIASVSFVAGDGSVRLIVADDLNASAARQEASVFRRERHRVRQGVFREIRRLATAALVGAVLLSTAFSSQGGRKPHQLPLVPHPDAEEVADFGILNSLD